MKFLVVISFAILCLMGASSAHANRWSDADVQKAITTADARWPDSPCFGQHHISWLTYDAMKAEIDAVWPGSTQVNTIGFGSYEGCQVWIAWDRIFHFGAYGEIGMLCTLLEHEFGHNAGMRHSDDPNDVMYPSMQQVSGDCMAAFPLPTKPRNRRWHIAHLYSTKYFAKIRS
jgi:hypothetical protein